MPSAFEHYSEGDVDRLLEQLEREELADLAQDRLDQEDEIVFVDGIIQEPVRKTTLDVAPVEEEEEAEQKKEEAAAALKVPEEHTLAPARSASITDEFLGGTGFGGTLDGSASAAGEMFASPRNSPGSFLGKRRRR